jgi:HAD superfamily hydrolase (TIGR01509 family)
LERPDDHHIPSTAPRSSSANRDAVPAELVIFDCDGVLVDTERIAVRVDVEVFKRLGLRMSDGEVIEQFLGRSDADIGRDLEKRLGRPLGLGWEAEFEPLYREAFRAELRPVPGLVEALDEITLETCVATSGSHDKVRYTLGLVGLYERFAGRIFSVMDVSRGKPAPDLFLHAAHSMGVPPAACAVVEDSPSGVEAGVAAGMRTFGYGGGLTPRTRLEAAGAVVFDHMRDLPQLLLPSDVGSRGG